MTMRWSGYDMGGKHYSLSEDRCRDSRNDSPRWGNSRDAATFSEAPDTFWRRSPIRYGNRVTTPAPILRGERDERVPPGQAGELCNAPRSRDVPARLVVYPRERGAIEERRHQRDQLERVIGWFDEHVKGQGGG